MPIEAVFAAVKREVMAPGVFDALNSNIYTILWEWYR